MRLGGRRQSANVEDRRGKRGPAVVGGGIGVLVLALVVWMLGGNPLQVLNQVGPPAGQQQAGEGQELSEEAQARGLFAKQILASTEDVWTKIFRENGSEYTPCPLVLFSGSTNSGCGPATSATGPFYCPADTRVYLDPTFFDQMSQQLGAPGDFAQAYVLAHEVGHHIQQLQGRTDWMQQQRRRLGQKENNQLSVRLELQADYYAGVWAHHEHKMAQSLEPGDIQEGMDAAAAIGDDRLQMEAKGFTVPHSYTHGTSEQRLRWFLAGLRSGDLSGADTFEMPYNEL